MIQNGEFTSRVHVCESHAHPVFNQSLSGFICIICSHTRIAIAFAPGSTPDFNKWQGCSNGGKSQTSQKSLDQNSTPKKSHAEIPSHKNFQNALNAIARKKETLVLNNFVPRALFPGFGGGAGKPGKSALGTRLSFEYLKKPLLRSSYPKNYLPNFCYPKKFCYPKIPKSRISNPKQSLDHLSCHLKFGVPHLSICPLEFFITCRYEKIITPQVINFQNNSEGFIGAP